MALTKVNLANTVEGILPVANGGTGTSTGVSPGGSTTQVQYNSSGSFAGSSNFVFDGTNLGVGASSVAASGSRTVLQVANGSNGGALLLGTNATAINNPRVVSTSTTDIAVAGGGASGIVALYTNDTERMRVDSSGNIGIGTASPGELIASKLDVNAGDTTGANIAVFRTGNATAANNAGGGFYAGASATATSRYAQMWLDADGANFSGSDYFFINKAGNSGNVTYDLSSAAAHIWKSNAGTERMRIDSSGNLQLSTANTSILNSSGRKILNQSGSVLQVVSALKQDTFSTSTSIGSGGAAITGLSATITPSSTSSTILVIVNCYGSGTSGATVGFVQCYRNGTLVGAGTPSGSRPGANGRYYLGDNNHLGNMGFSFSDSPSSTSALTYQVNAATESGSSTTYINRTPNDTNSALGSRMGSSIILMEISA